MSLNAIRPLSIPLSILAAITLVATASNADVPQAGKTPAPAAPSVAAPSVAAKPVAAKPIAAPIAKPAPKPAPKPVSAKTSSQTLARVTSDRDGNVSRLVAIVDSAGQIQSIRFDTKHQDTQATTSVSFSMKQIASRDGVVLTESSGYKAIILKGNVDSKKGVGKITVNFLTDAFQSTYESCRAGIQRSDDGKWTLVNVSSRKPVQELYVQSHMTGITTIRGICN